MWSTARTIAAGDVVIVWMTRDNIVPLQVTAGLEFNNRFGVFRHSDLIGHPYGTKVPSRNGRGFVYVLRPTPELWTLSLPHRTQILYLADIAFIVTSLNIRPGCTVIEAGTGSGSFSHSVARTIGPSGRLYSFEFHEERATKARDEFAMHGMTMVHLSHRNVCQQGFALRDEADAVFLDLPAPWEAVPHAKSALKKDRLTRICCFSPCIEQVLRTITALNQSGFTDLTMYETLIRPHDVHQVPKPISIDSIVEQVKLHEVKKEQRRLQQVAASDKKRESRKRKREEAVADEEDGPDPDLGTGDQKRRREGDNAVDTATLVQRPTVMKGSQDSSSFAPVLPSERKEARLAALATSTPMAKPVAESRGHTSYLTFASLLPCKDRICPGMDENVSTPVEESATA
ncbi:tRNA (adenine-N(1)-)-methyltransferase catalytic subunit trm61 [Serendipita sp. 396]|nr:tRNA (adenine-N(1)-)-methyltransferase catalytic subunit trm61 [Serendipita sp. 396]KAG8787637.1 tRNA (adenine-N(1)-)-methyltransferase catalytic subunit trm61 [Serendipita sp. 397]KAG8826260.1 tRNA (adenine-N(1)-)-methyltransferase catalytic subunit trm61 [Serendipita sp. 401]KAG8836820.1 tRNA (adenine-N(1)-)-methyltransferase catalytic subunit trm61 [Serendipita sp. 400]KAG9055976.1 tRNA (adenine-N(1)-)-methyltransferase catalytic subunit trm61 [Serendipita sp. 407]